MIDKVQSHGIPFVLAMVANFFGYVTDINLGIIATAVTTLGLAIVAVYTAFSEARRKTRRQAAEDEIELQRKRDEANKISLSGQIDELKAKLHKAEQAVEAEHRLRDTLNIEITSLRGIVDDMRRTLDESRERSHEERNRVAQLVNRQAAELNELRANIEVVRSDTSDRMDQNAANIATIAGETGTTIRKPTGPGSDPGT